MPKTTVVQGVRCEEEGDPNAWRKLLAHAIDIPSEKPETAGDLIRGQFYEFERLKRMGHGGYPLSHLQKLTRAYAQCHDERSLGEAAADLSGTFLCSEARKRILSERESTNIEHWDAETRSLRADIWDAALSLTKSSLEKEGISMSPLAARLLATANETKIFYGQTASAAAGPPPDDHRREGNGASRAILENTEHLGTDLLEIAARFAKWCEERDNLSAIELQAITKGLGFSLSSDHTIERIFWEHSSAAGRLFLKRRTNQKELERLFSDAAVLPGLFNNKKVSRSLLDWIVTRFLIEIRDSGGVWNDCHWKEVAFFEFVQAGHRLNNEQMGILKSIKTAFTPVVATSLSLLPEALETSETLSQILQADDPIARCRLIFGLKGNDWLTLARKIDATGTKEEQEWVGRSMTSDGQRLAGLTRKELVSLAASTHPKVRMTVLDAMTRLPLTSGPMPAEGTARRGRL